VRGTRCFEILLKDGGELVARGVQEVVVLDSKTLRPVPLSEGIIDSPRMEDPRVFEPRKFPRFQLQREAAFVVQRAVEWRDLDSQEHVNDAPFAAFAEDAAAQALAFLGWSPSDFKEQGLAMVNGRVQIQYQSPAAPGETLEVVTYLVDLKPTGGVWYFEIERAADREPIAQCLIEWSLADRASGKEQALPESLFQSLKERVAR